MGGRQIGKTTVTALKALSHAVVHPRSTILIVSPSLRQSLHLFSYIARFVSTEPLDLLIESLTRTELRLVNDSRILSLPSSPNTIRGYTANLVIVDEANFIDEELITTVLFPTLSTTGGYLWLISTPCSKEHIFYRIYESGKDWSRFRIPSTMNPLISRNFLESQRSILGVYYRQEYEAEYIDEVYGIFNTANLLADEPISKQVNLVLVDVGGYSDSMGVLYCHMDGERLYVLDEYEGRGAYLEQMNSMIPRLHGSTTIVIDSTGVGKGVEEYLAGRGYGVRGIVWSRERERDAIVRLMHTIQSNNILISPSCTRLIRQLKESTIKNGRLTTISGEDDLLYALMLAYADSKRKAQVIRL
ncbi:MAG: terminase family protein [Candidatus Nitrosocaldus sp.]|nr:terminase large subunit [Candidatus Nitrosocaldus sp.]MDW8001008.1 terminase family protein [Candidatus Nitrosocaldus sp.]MDW8275172.1 terminase family protein [Candidatus Nitrosocaldus sp.]